MHPPGPRRGSIAVLFAVSLVVLLGFGALVVDVGYMRIVEAQLKNAADASSHAATQLLDGTDEGVEAARSVAMELARRNKANGKSVSLDANTAGLTDGGLVLGEYDFEAQDFYPDGEVEDLNSARVSVDDSAVQAAFSSLAFGREGLRAEAVTTSARPVGGGAGGVECFLPLAVPSCTFDEHPEGEWNTIEFHFSSANDDNLGWGYIGEHPNASNVGDQLADCQDHGEVTVDDIVHLNNGVITSALKSLTSLVSTSPTSWDADLWGPMPEQDDASDVSNYGGTWERPLIIFDADDCSNLGFTHSETITGFAWGVVYDVSWKGSDKMVKMRIETMEERDIGTQGGGEDFGVVASSAAVFVK